MKNYKKLPIDPTPTSLPPPPPPRLPVLQLRVGVGGGCTSWVGGGGCTSCLGVREGGIYVVWWGDVGGGLHWGGGTLETD